ncbi:hypothetical protein TRIP_C90430 [Candidatus Zixiibacteriota bacterium]|nr:hypothetical protein TRIP_C90430 [candidate division Zixibacteria bacterium]
MENKILLKINGMSCNGCAANVQRALKSVAGVSSAEVNLPSKSAVVFYEGNPPSMQQLTEAVKKAGYEALPTA